MADMLTRLKGVQKSGKGWTALAAFIRECLKVLGTDIRHC